MSKEHEQLIASFLSGEDVAEALLQACRNDPQLLVKLADHAVVDRLLAFQPYNENENLFAAEVRQRLESKEDESFVHDVHLQLQKEKRRKPIFFIRLAAAACVVISLTLFLKAPDFMPGSDLAQLTSSRDAVWKTQALENGDSLKKGLISLNQGYSEITMNNGVRLILEAPIELELKSLDLIKVNHGRLVARVPKPAIGFTVLTPSSEVVDLGTEFGISVDDKGASEVHVLDGEVKARPLQQKTFSNLVVNEGMAIDENQQVTLIQSNPSKFRRALPGRSSENPNYLHWSCDGEERVLECGGTGIYGQFYPGEFKALEGGEGPTYQNGQFGEALYLNGKDAYVTTDFPGIGGNHPRTVAFWTKVPRDFTFDNGYAMLGWGLMEKGSAWQVSPNPTPGEGPLGRLRIGTKSAQVIGTTDLRDNRWHHVAIVMYGGDEADVSTHILMYVDGRLEKTSIKSVAKISTQLDHPSSRPLMFGRNLRFVDDSENVGENFFRGWLDEIYIFDTALEQEKIQSLMESNGLPN
ncbi:MAG: FecR domain-containing protein [Verrucomicrobia bacterium]|nr:FecR domain-containing protein [Verrucomicrobiota bacterium]